MRLLAFATLAALLLAGCGTVPRETTFTVPDDAPSAADTHTGDGYDLRVHVTDQDGAPVAGAAVVYFTMSDAFGGSVNAEATAGEDGARAVAFWQGSFSEYDMVAGVRTDSDGWAVADLEPGRTIHIAAGGVDGFTTEARTNIAVGGGGESGSLTVPLYPEHITYSFDVSVGNHVGTGGLGQGSGDAFEIAFHDEGHGEAYRNRIYDLHVTATWSQGPEGVADYHLGVGDAQNVLWQGQDQHSPAFEQTETLEVTSSDLDGSRASLAETGYHAHVMTNAASLTIDGVDVHLEVEATLKGSNIKIQ